MPETSEGFAPSGLEPNSAVKKTDLAPEKFDAQTAEIFLLRLNKALGTPERTTFDEALGKIEALRNERDTYHGAAGAAWKYFHQRIGGLSCGLGGSWEQALNELTAYIKNLQAQIKTLEQQGVKSTAERGASISVEQVTVSPNLAPPRTGALTPTDRALLVEAIPDLIVRVEQLEKVVYIAPIKQS